MKNFCIRRGKCVSAALILCLNFIAMPAYGELLKKSGHEHGTTTLYLPQNLCNVRINNLGEITGTCNRISVAHSDSGAFCAKVNSVQVILNGALANHFVKPTRMPNLCNFNVNDVWFDPIFPIQNADYQTSEIARLYSKVCRDTGRNGTQILTKHPMFDQGVNLVMGYGGIDGPRFYNEWHSIPPVNLTCDPCAQLAVKDSLLVPPNQLVSIQDHSIVAGGGIAPYIINFSVLPPGLFHQGYVITGRAAPGVYNSTVTVTDS